MSKLKTRFVCDIDATRKCRAIYKIIRDFYCNKTQPCRDNDYCLKSNDYWAQPAVAAITKIIQSKEKHRIDETVNQFEKNFETILPCNSVDYAQGAISALNALTELVRITNVPNIICSQYVALVNEAFRMAIYHRNNND